MSVYLLDALPTDRPFSWTLTCDPNKRHGGLLAAIDHVENWYCVAEHYRESIPDRLHAEAYLAMLAAFRLTPNRDVSIFADPGGAGAQAIINMGEVGLYATPIRKDAGSVKASIERIRRQAWVDPGHMHPLTGALGAPRLYFLRSLRSQWTKDGVEYDESRLLWELRQYRQKENGKPDEPVKENDDVVDPLRYLAISRPNAPLNEDLTEQRDRAKLDTLSQRASSEFDDLIARANRTPAQTGHRYW